MTRKRQGPCRTLKAPKEYAEKYRRLNVDVAFQIFMQELMGIFFHRSKTLDDLDKTLTLSESTCLPLGLCRNVVKASGPELLGTLHLPLGPGSRTLPVELLSVNGEEKAWTHEDTCKTVPVSLCLALDADGTAILAVKHSDRSFKMVETCLCAFENEVFLFGASAEGWAHALQQSCSLFAIELVNGVQCTKEFLAARRDRAGSVTTEAIAAALSELRSATVLAIPRWSELPASEHWRELPMMAGWLAEQLAAT